MIGLADGFKMGWGLTTDAMERKRRQAIEDEQLTWQREDRARQNADRTRVDQAFRDYESLTKNGNVDATGTGLSAPSAQMVYAGNAGYGQGEAAVKEMAGDYAREMGRFAQAPGAPAGGLPKYDNTAPVTTSAASEVDLERALGGIAAAQRDVRGIRESKANTKALKLEEGRRAEIKRLSGMKPADLVNIFQEQNKDGSGVPAMLGFDEKTNRFVFTSNIPGVPTQTLSRAELMNEMMGLWEAGNGDYAKGLSMMLEGAKTRRDLDNQTYTRTAGVAQGNADLFWRNRQYGLSAEQLNIARGHLGIARDREARDSYQLINPQTNYTVAEDGSFEPVTTGLRWNKKSGSYDPVVQPMGPEHRGLIPAAVLDPKKYEVAAKAMVDSGAIAGIGADRKPVPHTMQTALRALMDEGVARYRAGKSDPLKGRLIPGQVQPGGPAAAAPAGPETTQGPDGRAYWRMPGEQKWRPGTPSASAVRDAAIDRTLGRGMPTPGVMTMPGEEPAF